MDVPSLRFIQQHVILRQKALRIRIAWAALGNRSLHGHMNALMVSVNHAGLYRIQHMFPLSPVDSGKLVRGRPHLIRMHLLNGT